MRTFQVVLNSLQKFWKSKPHYYILRSIIWPKNFPSDIPSERDLTEIVLYDELVNLFSKSVYARNWIFSLLLHTEQDYFLTNKQKYIWILQINKRELHLQVLLSYLRIQISPTLFPEEILLCNSCCCSVVPTFYLVCSLLLSSCCFL